MKNLFALADRYLQESSWKDLALVKLCLCAIGVMMGLAVPRGKRKLPLLAAASVFALTYIPLMKKLLGIFLDSLTED